MIGLTAEYLREILIYNPNTGLFVWRRREDIPLRTKRTWNTRFAGKLAGNICSSGCCKIGINSKSYLAHRIAWLYLYGEWPKNEIDHENGIRSDNRIINLREATYSQNQQNQKKPYSNNKLGVLGVHWHAATKKFRAEIRINGKIKCLGYFKTAQEAHTEYIKAKRELHKFCTI